MKQTRKYLNICAATFMDLLAQYKYFKMLMRPCPREKFSRKTRRFELVPQIRVSPARVHAKACLVAEFGGSSNSGSSAKGWIYTNLWQHKGSSKTAVIVVHVCETR